MKVSQEHLPLGLLLKPKQKLVSMNLGLLNRKFGIGQKHRSIPSKSGRASTYEIKCRNSSFYVGEYVVPSKCAYFRLHLKKSTNPGIFRNYSSFPEETVKMYIDGLHSIPLELGCNQAVQLLEFLIHDGKAEIYSLPR